MVSGKLAFSLLACLLAAGCVGGPTGSVESMEGEPTATTAATTDAPVTRPTPTSTPDQPAYGTQFVSVERYANQSRGTSWPADERSTFENLSDARQDVFLEALEDGQVQFGPDESNPFDWNDEDRPRAVNYEGEWYYVRVAIV